MKKRISIIIVITLILSLTLTLTACNFGKGENGLSAYEIAVKHGFHGTEEEWLASLTTVTKSIDNNYNINIDNASDVSAAANIGLKSIVSVYCKHTVWVSSWPFGQQQQQEAQSAGSGVIYKLENDGTAYIITNHHVVYEYSSAESDKISKNITLYLYGMEGSDYGIPAQYVGGSLNYDIAVLKVEQNAILKNAAERGTASAVTLADSNDIKVGQTSIAIGNPEAEGISVTSGVVSVDSEYINMTAVDNKTKISLRVIRTDTAVNSGNSGGGLFDATGKLIGVVNAKVSDSSVENIAYAIPCNVAKAIADNIIYYNSAKGANSVMRVILGVTVQTGELSTVIGDDGYIKKIEKTQISGINANSVVSNVLKVGDIIESVKIGDNKTTITRQYQFIDALLNARVGNDVELVFIRDGECKTATITIPESCLEEY